MSVSPAPATPRGTASLPIAWRRPAVLRAEGLPMIPIMILVTLALVAILAELIAPYNPEVGASAGGSARRRGSPAAARRTCSAPTTSAATSSRG